MDVASWLRGLGLGQYENMFRDNAVIKRGRKIMRSYMWTAVLLAAALLASGDAKTQQPAAGGNPLDVVPEKMPFNTPYGTPISLPPPYVSGSPYLRVGKPANPMRSTRRMNGLAPS